MATKVSKACFSVEQINSRDRMALDALVREYTPQLRRAGLGMGLNVQEVEELVQNTWTTFLEVAKRFEGRSKVRTFLFGIMYNKVRELRRDIKKHDHAVWQDFEERFDGSGHWIKAPENSEQYVERVESVERIQECVEKLPQQQRLAFVFREIEELATSEVVEVMRVSVNNLGVLIFRAKTNLRRCLESWL